jgi:hypothetical protein
MEIVKFVLAGVFFLVSASHAGAQDARIAPFLGTYVGEVVFATDQGLEKRELDVRIQAEGDGFSVQWSTVRQKIGGKVKKSTHFVAFGNPDRNGVFLPKGSIERFGEKIAIDPLQGRPQLWATVRGKTLVINATVQTDRGGLEKQIYERKLVPGGLELNFLRTRDGQPLKSLHVKMKTKNQKQNLQ